MSIQVPLPSTYWDGLIKGVNFSVRGTGGPECLAYIPTDQKILETLLALFICVSFIFVASRRLSIDIPSQYYGKAELSVSRQIILVLLCLTYGVEIGYKLSTSSVIWLVNPCHLLTMAQIVLLAAPNKKWVTVLFRITMHSLHGAVVALLLPVTNTRRLPFEVVVYWVQHILISTIPSFLLYQKGPYIVEPLHDWSWPVLSLGILYFIYWFPIQFFCIATQINLNNMICPAISDPFYGRGYRLWAMLHCGICILIFGKIYTFVSLRLFRFLGQKSEVNAIKHENDIAANNQHANGNIKHD